MRCFCLIEAPLQVYNNWIRAEGGLQWNVQPIVSILFWFISDFGWDGRGEEKENELPLWLQIKIYYLFCQRKDFLFILVVQQWPKWDFPSKFSSDLYLGYIFLHPILVGRPGGGDGEIQNKKLLPNVYEGYHPATTKICWYVEKCTIAISPFSYRNF